MESIPNPRNFCGGNFQDWLEVNLLERCNAQCAWCIERGGYHPEHHATVEEMAKAAISTGKKNIILLGGEPLLYREINTLIGLLIDADKNIWITTNGFLLTPKYIVENLKGITGVNISIHDFDMQKNKEITKILIDEENLKQSITLLHAYGVNIRMNCNTIKNYIDTPEKIVLYVQWAKSIGADKVRFAELKQDDEEFIDLSAILNHKYGLNDNPFVHGCNSDCVIEGIPVNFRQMCGLQTSRRIAPLNPKQYAKEVLYYDGKIYDGWQTKIEKENTMKEKYEKLLQTITKGKLTPEEYRNLAELVDTIAKAESTHEVTTRVEYQSSGGCQY